jgi:predicted DNA-binding protein with PD1-like motif
MDLPTPRRVTHPGAEIEPRVLSQVAAEPGRELRLNLPEGTDILNGLGEILKAEGITTAGVRLGGGSFKKFSFYTGVVDPTGNRVATFSDPNFPALPVNLVIANVMIGIGEDGEARSHCHAIFLDGDGNRRGGHLIPGECIIGPGGLVAWATSGGTADLKVRYDPETNFPLLHPAKAEATT